MDKQSMIDKVKEKMVFKEMERRVPDILSSSPEELPNILKKYQKRHSLSSELLGDFIQKILIEKHKIPKKNPEYKPILLDFAKENRIVGLVF